MLTARESSLTGSVRDAKRARLILLAASGMSSAKIAKALPMSEEYVAMWRRRFLEHRIESLKDAPRPGGRRRISHDDTMAIAATATSAKDPSDPVWPSARPAAVEGEPGLDGGRHGASVCEPEVAELDGIPADGGLEQRGGHRAGEGERDARRSVVRQAGRCTDQRHIVNGGVHRRVFPDRGCVRIGCWAIPVWPRR